MPIMTFTKFLNEGVGNFEVKKLARELYSVIKKVQGCDYIEIVTSDINNLSSTFKVKSTKSDTLTNFSTITTIHVDENKSIINIVMTGQNLSAYGNAANKAILDYTNKNYNNQLESKYISSQAGDALGIDIRFKQTNQQQQQQPNQQQQQQPNQQQQQQPNQQQQQSAPAPPAPPAPK